MQSPDKIPLTGRTQRATSSLLAVTSAQAERLVRLPMWLGLSESQQQRVCDVLRAILLN